MTEFKPGDRVKVEYETEFVHAVPGSTHATVRHPGLNGANSVTHVPISALSKLPDPEPEWRKGDVVRFQEWQQGPFHVALRTGGCWQCQCGQDFRDDAIHRIWCEGRVTVLHREDPS